MKAVKIAPWCVAGVLLLSAAGAGLRAQTVDVPEIPDEIVSVEDPAEAGAPRAEEPAPTLPRVMPDMQRLAADSLARTLILWLREINDPLVEEYQAAARAIRLVRRLTPDDEELLRLELDAWTAADDGPMILDATERLVRMNPQDTVAQLRLITMRLRRLQSVEDRLAAYDRFLGPQGRALDPSILSRLALDAALLARETGDEQGFIDRLTRATSLDVTNKDAAALHTTYFLDRTSDPRERVDLLANLLLADPNDAGTHTNLSRELFSHGAYAAAARFMERAAEINQSVGIRPGVEDFFDRYLLVWMTDGDDALLEQVSQMYRASLSMTYQARRQLERQGLDPQLISDPLLPVEIETLRLALGFALGVPEAMEQSVQRIVDRTGDVSSLLERREAPYDGLSDLEVLQLRAQLSLQRLVARLWAGVQIDEAESDLATLTADDFPVPLGREAAERFRGLLLMRRGGIDEAEAILAPLAEKDALSLLGLGMIAELRGDMRGALRSYATLALRHANSAAGCAARRRIEVLRGEPLAPTPAARALNDWSRNFAPWINDMTKNASAYMSLTARHVTARIDPFGRAEVRIEMRNSSRQPMAVGPDHTFNSRLLFTPRMVVRGDDVSAILHPEPVELDRRLRLMPGESIVAHLWTARASVGMYLDHWADRTVTLRWRVIQGYRVDKDRRFSPGIISVTTQTDMMLREHLPEQRDPDKLVEAAASARGRDYLETVLRMMVSASTRRTDESMDALAQRRKRFAAALASRFGDLSEFEKVYTICTVQRAGIHKDARDILDAAQHDPSPFVRTALLLTAVESPDEPALLRWAEDPDEDLRALAQCIRTRFTTGRAVRGEGSELR